MKAGADRPAGGPADLAQTVGEFNRRVRVLLKEGIPPGWVRGEVSNLRAQASGHVYFSLKDSSAQLSAVIFRGDALRLRVPLRDGLQVLAFGEVDVYEPQGKYQLIVRPWWRTEWGDCRGNSRR
jgi:exodeoxyribonuclease VII large subunit